MPTTSLAVRYRPLRVGFVVQDGDLAAFGRAVQINSLLWGGSRNPILPVGENPDLLEQWISLFSIDLLTPLGDSPGITAFMQAHPYLRTPGHFADEIFYEDWRTKKLEVGLLDIIHIIDHYWEAEFRHKPAGFKSNCVVVEWAPDDPCGHVLAASFGVMAPDPSLKYDFRDAFEKGLRARVEVLRADAPIPATLDEWISPIALAGDRLQQFGGSLREDDGIYVGRATDFADLVTFWNLRAAGTELRYLPHEHFGRFRDVTQAWLARLDAVPSRPPGGDSWIGIHWRADLDTDVRAVVEQFHVRKRLGYCQYDPILWNGLNIVPSQFYLGHHSVLGSVDRQYGREAVSFALPEKPAPPDTPYRSVGFQHLAALVSPLVEHDYPGHTLKPPPLRGLSEFLSRELTIDPWKLRTDPEGLALTIQLHDSSESLFPVPHQELIRRVLGLVGVEAEPSAPGRLAGRIIKQMREPDALDACRVFKIRGVRRLLKDLRVTDAITWNAALRIIGREAFGQFKDLYIESRKTPHLTPPDVLTFLVKKGILRPRLGWCYRLLRRQKEIRCGHCALTSTVLFRAFEGTWQCPFCKEEEDLAPRIATAFRGERREWVLKKAGLFAKDNNQQGALPVILTLLQLLRVLHSSNFMYSGAMNLAFKGQKCETDFVALSHGRRDRIELALGECKDEGGIISKEDVENLREARAQFARSGIQCYLVFAKTADSFTAEELERFASLYKDYIPVVLLTNRELEPYNPYWDAGSEVPNRYALSLADMARNSAARYLPSAVRR